MIATVNLCMLLQCKLNSGEKQLQKQVCSYLVCYQYKEYVDSPIRRQRLRHVILINDPESTRSPDYFSSFFFLN